MAWDLAVIYAAAEMKGRLFFCVLNGQFLIFFLIVSAINVK